MLLVRHPTTYAEARSYVLDVVLREFLQLDFVTQGEQRDDLEIVMVEPASDARLLVCDCLFATPGETWLTDASLPARPLARWSPADASLAPRLLDDELPVVYGERLPGGSYYEQDGVSARLGLDVFGSVFFQLTRYEEIVERARDEHDRFPARASLAHEEGFLARPLVNEYVELLWSALARVWPSLRRRRRESTVRPSHDVDWLLHSPLSPPKLVKAMIGDLVRRRDGGVAAARLQAARARRRSDPAADPYNAFELIMDHSERAGLRSAFYFQAGRTDARFDGVYSIDEPWIGELIRRIHERGHELGLHPSYRTFRDPGALRREFDALVRACARVGVEQPEWGARQHFLRWENPTTWRGYEQAGLAYDASLGYSSDPGFRCGVCLDYPVFDLLADRRLRLRERPLVAMEMALFGEGRPSDADGLRLLARLRDRCELFDGELTLLWHNSRLASRRERRLYASALALASERPHALDRTRS